MLIAALRRPSTWLAAVLVLASGAGCERRGEQPGPEAGDPPPAGRTNVLFVSIDDLNDWIEPLDGHPGVRTPNMSQLAAMGMTFTNAHASAPVCNPSRISLMTGLDPATTGVFSNDEYPLRDVLPDVETLTQHFMRDGYYVAGFGKIFHRDDNRTEPWDEYEWSGGRPKPADLPAHGITELTADIYRFFDWGPVDAAEEEWGEHKATSSAIDVVQRDHERPFFIAVGYRLPHLPWYAPRKYFDLYQPERISLPEAPAGDLDDLPPEARAFKEENMRAHRLITRNDRWRDAVVAYMASISFIDAQVGRLLHALEASPYSSNTVVVLWSDHGFHLGDKERWRKFTLWERSTRVPLILAGPGVARPGSRSNQPVSLLDIYPTLIDLTRLSPKDGLDGLSLAPLLKDPAAELPRDGVVTTDESGNARTVRSDRWRYIRYENHGEELYDHRDDPKELTNLAQDSQYGEIKDGLAQGLDR